MRRSSYKSLSTPFIYYNDSADCQRLNPQEGQEQCHWKSVCEISTSRGRALCRHVRLSSLQSYYVSVARPLISLVKCLNAPEQFEEAAGSQDDIRVEAAQVITSLSYGAGSLLRTSFPRTLTPTPRY